MYEFEKKEETYFTKAIYAYGINKNVSNPFFFLDENSLFYCVGINAVIHSLLEKKQKFLLSNEKSYGIICLGISNDKKLLALGEKSLKEPFITIFTNNCKFVKKLNLTVADYESKIMNISFSSKNKYIYCITNASTKSLFLCYDWVKEKLIFSKIFAPTVFNEFSEIHLNGNDSSYISLISINLKKEKEKAKEKEKEKKKETRAETEIETETEKEKETDIGTEKKNESNIHNTAKETKMKTTTTLKCDHWERQIFLYHNVDRNLEEIKIKNRKLDKVNNNFINCCWLNNGVLLLTNKTNHLIFWDVKKEKLKIYNKHISSNEILKITKCSRGFTLFDFEHIYIYEKDTQMKYNLNFFLKFYIPFNYSHIFNNYCLFSFCENYIFFLSKDGSLKKFDLTKKRIHEENWNDRNFELLRNLQQETGSKEENEKENKEENKQEVTKDEGFSLSHLKQIDEEQKEKEIKKEKGNFLKDSNGVNAAEKNILLEEEAGDVQTVLQEFNSGKINDFDVCVRHPMIIICYDDNSIKVINYKKKNMVMSCSFNNEPLCLSIHCTGHLLLVSFTDKLRLFHILYNKLKIKKEFYLKQCSCCKFSNGGNLMAVSKISTIYIYKTYTYDLMFMLKSHVNYISDLLWSFHDFSIFSIGKDGYLFEYALFNNGNKNIEIMQKEKKFLSIDVEILNEKEKTTSKTENDKGKNKNYLELIKYDNEYKNFSNLNIHENKNIYVSCDDKTIKQYCNSKIKCVLESEYVMNKILLYKNKFLITSYYNGFFCRIRFYVLPLTGLYLEIPCHALNSVNLKLDFHKELLFSCSKDGSIYIFSIEKITNFIHNKNSRLTEKPLIDITTKNKKKGDDENMQIATVNVNKNDNRKNEKIQKYVERENYKDANETKQVSESTQSMTDQALPKSSTKDELTNAFEAKKNETQQCLLYDLDNKTNYILREEEKENDEILIDFFYIQKKSKEVIELQKKIVNLKNQMELEMKNKESIYKDEMKKLKKIKNLEITNLNKINKSLIKEKEKVEMVCKESIIELEEKHTYFVNQLNSQFYLTNKIHNEKFCKLEEEFKSYKQQSINEILSLKNEHEKKLQELIEEKNKLLQLKQNNIDELKEQLEHVKQEKEEYIKQIEEDVDEEILTITQRYEEKIKEMTEKNFQLMGKSKLNEYIEEELRQNIQNEKEKFILNNIASKRLQESIENMKIEIEGLKENILLKEKEISNKHKEIFDLNKKNEELEKLRIVLMQKIKDLESSLSPKNSEIQIMKTKIDEMTKCFENNHKKTVSLQIEINEYKMKIKALHDDLLNTNKTIGNYEKILKNLQDHIKECYLHLHDKKLFNSSFINLYNKFHKVNDVKNYDSKNIFSEYIRQKEHLENMIEITKAKLEKETETFRKEKIKMMNQNSILLKEINDLKMDLNFLKTECQEAKLKTGRMKTYKKRDKQEEETTAVET